MEEETRVDGEGNTGKIEEETYGILKRNTGRWQRKHWEDGEGNSVKMEEVTDGIWKW